MIVIILSVKEVLYDPRKQFRSIVSGCVSRVELSSYYVHYQCNVVHFRY